MSPHRDHAFVQATDGLIALYRSVERRTLDLPLLNFMPLLIFLWAILRFEFFFFLGVFLLVPVNFVIMIRNIFPGRWRYRPFFLRHIYYVWLWIWRGEAPTTPFIFIRPLLSVFMKQHFESRLRRLRREIALQDELSDVTRSALVGRLDAALEQWRSPRLVAPFFTVIIPGIISIPTWYQKVFEFVDKLDILPKNILESLVAQSISTGVLFFVVATLIGYILTIPITAFLAKRGLFIGLEPKSICFPGSQDGSEFYSMERTILSSIGLQAREHPMDLWLSGAAIILNVAFLLLGWKYWTTWIQSYDVILEKSYDAADKSHIVIAATVQFALLTGLLFLAALRRRKTGRV